MTIIGIEGGIGTGKTLSLVYLGLEDLFDGKRLFSNVTLKNIPKSHSSRVTMLTKDELKRIFELVKAKKFDMRNSTVLIQEAHNYIDSRTSMFRDNRMITYWILQSRHTGEGSCDIIYDTQDLIQVDKRLRMNTDFCARPMIMSWIHREGKKLPNQIILEMFGKIGHKQKKFSRIINVKDILDKYDTHEIVDF